MGAINALSLLPHGHKIVTIDFHSAAHYSICKLSCLHPAVHAVQLRIFEWHQKQT